VLVIRPTSPLSWCLTRDVVLFAAVLLLGEAVRTGHALQREKERSERLLLNVLPAPIATRLEE
jgi:hypothetical protein